MYSMVALQASYSLPRSLFAPAPPPVRTHGLAPVAVDVPDEVLLEAIQNGDERALETLYRRYQRLTYALALRLVGNEGTAEDILQEAFLAVWRRAASYDRERGSVKTWLTGIVHHRAVDRLRANPTVEVVDGFDLLPPSRHLPDIADRAIGNVAGEDVRRALEELPAEQRQAITLAYFAGWTHVEIARHAGVPVGTVKGRMRLGLEKLRRQLAAYGPSH
jgi:RNA polymerase sigma-70 factor (ECF subfamily)